MYPDPILWFLRHGVVSVTFLAWWPWLIVTTIYLDPILLDGKILPWVTTAEHLGHTLHQSGSMDQDCKAQRAQFIQKSIDVSQKLQFAKPGVVMKAVRVYCSDSSGSMLWKLRSESSESFFKCWNTCVKLVNNVPMFTYLFWQGPVQLEKPGFFHGLLHSPSREVSLLANIVSRDPSSNTADNISYIRELTSLCPCQKVKDGDLIDSLCNS